MNKNKLILIVVILLTVAVGCFIALNKKVKIINPNRVNSFEACVDAGYAVQESFPRQCTMPSGKNFVEDIGNEIDKNPQQFMDLATNVIKNTLEKMMIDGIKYEKLKGENSYYAMELFENEELHSYLDNVVKVQNKDKTLYDYILIDSNVESQFAKDLETMEKVKFYFKLPYWFKIQTPIGSYNPDWAIVLKNDKKIYFVAETKSGGEIRGSEGVKIKCGRKHFEQLDDVKFERVETVLQMFGNA